MLQSSRVFSELPVACSWSYCTLVALLLGTCGEASAGRQILEFSIDGQDRSALVYTPEAPGPGPVPLVVVFHGRGDDSGQFARAVRLHKDWPDAIVVYPRGESIDSKPPMRGWQYRKGQYQDRDIKLTDRILDEIGKMYPTRPEHTFVAGFSNGGHFVFLLLKERSNEFAAFAAIGALQPDFESQAKPRPLMYLFGRNENPDYQEDWELTVKSLARHNMANGQQIEYLSCCKLLPPKPGGAVLAYGLYNAGHIWPYNGKGWLIDFFKLNTRAGVRQDGLQDDDDGDYELPGM